MSVFQLVKQKDAVKITLFLITLCFYQINSQLNCSNYYNNANLPQQCNSLTLTCIFPPFTNTTLISNETSSGQYSLCLDLPQYNIEVQEGKDLFQDSLYINTNNAMFNSGYFLQSLQSFIVVAVNSIILNNASIWSQNIWFQSASIQLLNTIIYNEGPFQTNCDCTTKGAVCVFPDYHFPFLFKSDKLPSVFNISLMNYTFQTWIYSGQKVNSLVILGDSSISISNTTIKISSMAIYSPSLTIDNSQLNNTGLGYSSGTGLGCGYFDQILNQLLGCTGTGASHGGYGGSSGPESCNLLMSRPPYDRQFIPKYPGSGGGFFLKELIQVSSGGGVINIQVNTLTIQSSNLISNGVNGIQGGGGGSGGSISIDFINSNNFGQIVISANGGDGKSSGGGGRIRYYDHNWTTISPSLDNQNVSIQASGGGGCEGLLTCGQNGSILTAPCPPGNQLSLTSFGCVPCPTGTFQVSYGYDECSSCGIKPANSQYLPADDQNQLNNFAYVCNFSCSPVYQLYNGKQCLNSFNYILAGVGGINLLICIGIIVATLVIFLVILMVRKLSLTDKSLFQQNQHIYIQEKILFQDIRYSFSLNENILLRGKHAKQSLANPLECFGQTMLALIIQCCASFFFQTNQRTQLDWEVQQSQKMAFKYFKNLLLSSWIVFSICFQIKQGEKNEEYYSFYLQSNRAVIQENIETNMGIKIHVNQQYTVGSLQIFNYKKQTLDFYIKNYFPIYFKLQRLHSGGYAIDFTDPIFKALCIQFQQKNDKNQKLQDYLIQLNQLLRNCDQSLSIFKHLWKVNVAWPSLQCHLWQPQNIILGIDDNLQINKNSDLFLAFCTEGRVEQNNSHHINQTLPLSSYSSQEGGRIAQSKYNKHFLYKCELPNIFFDQITSIRHKYHLKEVMIEMDEKKTVFWQIQNTFSQKSLSWILGTSNIVQLLLDLLSFFLIIFLLVDGKDILLYAFIPYFVLFPFCQFFMIFLSFSLLISKRAKIFTFALYFTLFSLIKYIILCIIILIIILSDGFNDNNILVINFYIWLIILIFNILSLVLLCMLHLHYGKIK